MRDIVIHGAVRVQKKQVLASRGAGGTIDAGRKSRVAVDFDETDPRKSFETGRGGGRVACMIDEHHFQIVGTEDLERFQTGSELGVRTIVDDQDRNEDGLSEGHFFT